eukprot:TRINITY_DN82751_c0_g1_i1.p1 TRINITY_DN82751_c0_g1~~TRINITY_DN82751_c0_g1_i1.p1  ORF type:complete len:260 (+),score=48.29 TRINITY_DN82751_c0_g1_i1:95-781(+)
MAELHTVQVALISAEHGEISVPPPSSAKFDVSRGYDRAEVLESILRDILERRRAQAGSEATGSEFMIRAAEIGVHDGRTSEKLLTALPSLELMLVDPWEYADDAYLEGGNFQTLYRNKAEAANMSDRVWDRLRPFRNRSNFVVQKSPEAASWAADQSLDLVFIDSFHTYEKVKKDIAAWLPKLRRWGVLAGHDYSLFWPGVCRAVHEFSHSTGSPLMLGADGVWWFHV